MGLLFTTEGSRRIKNTLNTAFDESPGGLAYIKGLATPPIPATPISAAIPAGPIWSIVKDRNWNPATLAAALDLMPYDQGSGDGDQGNGPNPHDPSKGKKKKDVWRWNYFLKSVIGTSTSAGSVFATLRSALADAILGTDASGAPISPAIVRVSFDHVELDENANSPGTAPPSVVIFDAPLKGDGGTSLGTVRHITLFTVRVDPSQAGSAFSDGPLVSGRKWQHPGNG
jgi:hypothetical protein